jgi:hypothetical protein
VRRLAWGKVVEINMIAPIYWAMELVAAVAKDRSLTTIGGGRNKPEKPGSFVKLILLRNG